MENDNVFKKACLIQLTTSNWQGTRMLEQGVIEEVRNRRMESEDERRRNYRITKFGRRVAAAEASRLEEALRQARATGILPSKA